MPKESFDYETPHTCQYPVTSYGTPEPEMSCGEAAPFLGRWINDETGATHGMWLCEEHLNEVIRCEEKYDRDQASG